MSRIRALALLAPVLVACGIHGYRVRVQANGFARIDLAMLSRLEDEAKSSGFAILAERREISAFPDQLTSSYSKDLSEKAHDFISIDIFCHGPRSSPPGTITVVIQNRLRGMEGPVKAQIDALGDRFQTELSSMVGRTGVTVEREPATIPFFL